MAKVTLIEAITMALAHEMERDESVIILGEDVGVNGGVFRATAGLQERFGADRVMDTPLAESMIAGLSVGMASQGMKPVAEIQFMGFIYPTVDQMINHAGRLRHRTRGPIGHTEGNQMKTFNLPDLGEGLQEAEIVTWHVKQGDEITLDQPMLSVETAKAVVEVPAPFSGRVARLHAAEGDIVETGKPLIDIDTGSGAGKPPASASPASKATRTSSPISGTNQVPRSAPASTTTVSPFLRRVIRRPRSRAR